MSDWASDFVAEVEARCDAFTMGWHAGHQSGVADAEADMAEAWMAEVHRIRALANPHDPWLARVTAAEAQGRHLAQRQWLNRDAWKSAAAQSVTEGARRSGAVAMTADDLARACGVSL